MEDVIKNINDVDYYTGCITGMLSLSRSLSLSLSLSVCVCV